MGRLFLAASAEPLNDAIAPWVKKLKIGADRKELSIRWVPEDLRHITLIFFGERTPEEKESILEAVAPVAEATAPMALKVEGLDAFPELRAGRVIWMGVQNSKKLRALRDRLADPLRSRGFDVGEAYTPHLTLGRLKSPKSLTDYLSPFTRARIGKLEFRDLVLYESIPTGAFHVYKQIRRFPLTGTAPPDETD